jgi:hypothetical protein
LRQNPEFYETAFHKVYGAYNGKTSDINPRTFDDFGGTLPEEGILNANGLTAAKRILNVLSDSHSDVEYCPNLPQMGTLK